MIIDTLKIVDDDHSEVLEVSNFADDALIFVLRQNTEELKGRGIVLDIEKLKKVRDTINLFIGE